jgi:hypothetical protein
MVISSPYICTDDHFKILYGGGVNEALFESAITYRGVTSTAENIITQVLNLISSLESARGVVFPCKQCYRDVVIGFFNASTQILSQCKTSQYVCSTFLFVQKILFKFNECSGISFFASPIPQISSTGVCYVQGYIDSLTDTEPPIPQLPLTLNDPFSTESPVVTAFLTDPINDIPDTLIPSENTPVPLIEIELLLHSCPAVVTDDRRHASPTTSQKEPIAFGP